MKNTKGITLVSLVITIIVLLILAGAAIGLAVNNNGLFENAKNAGDKWNTAAKGESDLLGNWTDRMDEYNGNVKCTDVYAMVYKKPNSYDKILIFSYDAENIENYRTANNLEDGAINHNSEPYQMTNILDVHWKYDYETSHSVDDLETFWNGDYDIKEVLFLNRIVPKYTSCWFFNLGNLLEINGIENLVTNNVTDMSSMFYLCYNLDEIDLTYFNTSNVTDMKSMFYDCQGLTTLNLSSFDTSNVTDMSKMFAICSGLNELDLSNFNTSNVTSMKNMFSDEGSDAGMYFKTLNISSFNTINVTDMSGMFDGCWALQELDLSNFNTSNVTNMSGMFGEIRGYDEDTGELILDLDLSMLDTSKVTNMNQMFSNASLRSLNLGGNFDTGAVTDMSSMFRGVYVVDGLDLTNFNTSSVENMSCMFSRPYYCTTPNTIMNLDLTSFDTSSVTDFDLMFCDLSLLEKIYVSNNFVINNGVSTSSMFSGCRSLEGGNGTRYSSSNYGNYARIDAPGTPGYFTLGPAPSED